MDEEAQEVVVYEEWAELYCFPGLLISSFGRFYSMRTHHFLQLNPTTKGRYQIKWTRGKEQISLYAHRLVAECFMEDFDEDLAVRHVIQDFSNNDIDNLYQTEMRARGRDHADARDQIQGKIRWWTEDGRTFHEHADC